MKLSNAPKADDHVEESKPAEIWRIHRGSARRYAALLGLVLLLAGLLRFYGLGREDYWLDELHSLANSAGRGAEFEAVLHGEILSGNSRTTDLIPTSTVASVWREMKADVHPPLYSMALWGWRQLVGDDEFAIRALSAIFSVLSILVFALIFLELGHPWAGVCGAAALALSYSHIRMAQEARPYAAAMFMLCVSYWAAVRLERRWESMNAQRRIFWGAVYALSAYLTVLTHYFGALALAGQILFVLASERREFRRAWYFWTGLACAAFVLSWGGNLWSHVGNPERQTWLIETRGHPWLHTLHRLGILPIQLLFSHEPFETNILLAVLGAVVVGAAILALRRLRLRESAVFVGWYVVPFAGFAFLEFYTQKHWLGHLRYPSFLAPGLVGLLICAALAYRRSVRVLGGILWLIIIGLTLRLPTPHNPKNDRAASLLASQLHAGDLLIFDPMDWPRSWAWPVYQGVSYYLPRHLATPMPAMLLLGESSPEVLKQQIAQYDRVFVIGPHIEAEPNPNPKEFRFINKTGYVDRVGFLFLFEKIDGT